MTTDQPEDEGDLFEQPADPFEPEAPAHLDPDAETLAHEDDESTVDGADPAPPQPS